MDDPRPPSGDAPRRTVVIVVSVTIAAAVAVAVVLMSINPIFGVQPGGPAAWALGPGPTVVAGSPGCQGRAGETCFAVVFSSNVGGVRLSGLRFAVVGPPWNNSSVTGGTPVPLGASASVTAIDPTGSVVGAWNWTQAAWVQGGSWEVPVAENVTLVLDTGIVSVSMTGDYFFTFMETPDYGAVGAYLP